MRGKLELPPVRVGFQEPLRQRIVAHPAFFAKPRTEPDAERRQLLEHSVVLTQAMAPELHAMAQRVAHIFYLDEPIELFQSGGGFLGGHKNACMGQSRSPIRIKL